MLEQDMSAQPKIFVSTAPFGEHDRAPLEMLRATGWNVQINASGRKLTPLEVSEQANDCDGIIAGTEDLKPLLAANRKLRVISRVGIGLDSVPLAQCRERGIAVAYTPDAVTPAVAELTIGTILGAMRHIVAVDRAMRRGEWRRAQGFRLGESVVGIVGLGRIGLQVARFLAPFRPRALLVNDVRDKSRELAELRSLGLKAYPTSLGEMLKECDVVSLHLPLTRETRNLIGAAELATMRPGSVLVNLSRGGIVDELALAAALRAGGRGGAALDVFEEEPYKGPLRELDNVLLTAHLGSCSVDCRARMEREAAADVIRYFRGEPMRGEVPAEEYENQK
jgi:D-3-phosphoglycerate dehydrogenase